MQSQIPCSLLYESSRSTVVWSRGSPTNRIPLASAAGPRNSGSDSIELHSETQQPHWMQSDSLLTTFMSSWAMRYSPCAGGST